VIETIDRVAENLVEVGQVLNVELQDRQAAQQAARREIFEVVRHERTSDDERLELRCRDATEERRGPSRKAAAQLEAVQVWEQRRAQTFDDEVGELVRVEDCPLEGLRPGS